MGPSHCFRLFLQVTCTPGTVPAQYTDMDEHIHKFTYWDQESVSFLREEPFNGTGKHLVAIQGFWVSFVLLTPCIYTKKVDHAILSLKDRQHQIFTNISAGGK